MSKIYEALQRAEQERLESTDKPFAPNPEASAAAAPAPVRPRDIPPPIPLWTPEPIPAATQPVQDAHVFDQLEADEAEEVPLDLEGIPTTLWKPLLQKLPALEERGGAVEQFRSLRTRLFAFRDLNQLKTIMISSGLPREGKSFIAANLAISFARHKASRVLLIDGDMRRSSLHTLFGCSMLPGLTDYLAGHAGALEIMQRAQLNKDGSPIFAGLGSLTFIGGGGAGEKAADLAGSKRFHKLIKQVSPYFDWIIVDSSPVNLVTDGVNLAHACDGVLMVARGGVTKFEAAQRALAELKSSKILGVVLNAVETPPSVDGYYGYGSYDTPEPVAGTTSR